MAEPTKTEETVTAVPAAQAEPPAPPIILPKLSPFALELLERIASVEPLRPFYMTYSNDKDFEDCLRAFASYSANGWGCHQTGTRVVVIFHFSQRGTEVLKALREDRLISAN